jgi:hypothetical protein
MEAKLAAIEDRVALLGQVLDKLESRLDRKDEMRADWALILRAAATVIEGEMRQAADDCGAHP